jgi:hypothetical protein
MYTNTQGVANNAQDLPSIITKPYSSVDIEGLINGGLYQDIQLADFGYNETEGKWPDIEPTDLVTTYKIFMWNRDTSWSCYIPTINIKNPIQLNDETIEYLPYVPAIPKKKVFGNLKYSHTTNYQTPYSIDIEAPQLCHDNYQGIIQFTSNNNIKNYYGSVNALVVNNDGYVLL